MRTISNYLALFVFSLAFAVPGIGFAGGYVWFDTLENTWTDRGKYVADLALHEGAIYVAARAVLIKYSTDGQELWRREPVMRPYESDIVRVATDADGVYVAGSSQDEDGYYRGLVQKFAHDGTFLWANIDDSDGGGDIWRLAVSDAGIYTAGQRYPEGDVLRLLTPDGETVWERLLGTHTSTGGLAVGSGVVYVAADDRIFVYDSNGNHLTDFAVPLKVGNVGINASGLVLHENHLYLVGGELTGPAYYTIVRTDLEGVVAWKRSLADYEYPGGLAATKTGVLLTTRWEDDNAREAPSAVLLHFDLYGVERELWSRTAGNSNQDLGPEVIDPGPIAITANQIYLGGSVHDPDVWTPFPHAFVSHLDMQPRYWRVARIADANGNGTPELAALRTLPDGTAEVIVKDTATKEQYIRGLPFAVPGALEIDVAGVLDMNGNGTPEVAVLLRKPNGQGVVQIRDAGTGKWITQMMFVGADWEVRALADLDLNGDQVSELAVLAQSDDLQSTGVQVRSSVTKAQVRWVSLPAPSLPEETVIDLASVEDVNGNGSPDLAVLYRVNEWWGGGDTRYVIADGVTRQLINESTIVQPPFPEPLRKALGLAGFRSPGPAASFGVAVLFDKPNGQGVAKLSSAATGAGMGELFFVGKSWAVRDITSQDLDGNGFSKISVLVEADDGSGSAIQIKDPASRNQVQWIGLPPN